MFKKSIPFIATLGLLAAGFGCIPLVAVMAARGNREDVPRAADGSVDVVFKDGAKLFVPSNIAVQYKKIQKVDIFGSEMLSFAGQGGVFGAEQSLHVAKVVKTIRSPEELAREIEADAKFPEFVRREVGENEIVLYFTSWDIENATKVKHYYRFYRRPDAQWFVCKTSGEISVELALDVCPNAS